MPTPNTRWRSLYDHGPRRAGRIEPRRAAGMPRRPRSATFRRRSNTPSGSSTAPASPRTRPRPRRWFERAARGRQSDRPEPACPHPRRRRRTPGRPGCRGEVALPRRAAPANPTNARQFVRGLTAEQQQTRRRRRPTLAGRLTRRERIANSACERVFGSEAPCYSLFATRISLIRSDLMARTALMNVMVNAVLKAGRGLARDFGEVENLQVSLKGPGDFVSAADHRADKTLIAELGRARPRLRVPDRGERRDPRRGRGNRWIIDPLDGTTNFLHGIPLFAISLALEREGQIVGGGRLQSGHQRALCRRARRRRLPQRPAPARRAPPEAPRYRHRHGHAAARQERRGLSRRAATRRG